jgi:hypothetical protein
MSTLRYVVEQDGAPPGKEEWFARASFFALADAIQYADMWDVMMKRDGADVVRLRDTKTDEILGFRNKALEAEAERRLDAGEGIGYIKPTAIR